MAGRANVYFDEAKGSFEVYFKVDGITYSFIAESNGTSYDDTVWKIQMRKKWAGNTEAIEDTKDVENAFVEAMNEWVELKNPTTFWWVASEKFPAYNNIAKTLAKKIKEYNFIDESAILEEQEPKDKSDLEYDFDGVEEENKYKRFIFTRDEIKEDFTSEEMANRKLESNEETFDTYEEPEDVKTNKDFTTFVKNDKLDKEAGY